MESISIRFNYDSDEDKELKDTKLTIISTTRKIKINKSNFPNNSSLICREENK